MQMLCLLMFRNNSTIPNFKAHSQNNKYLVLSQRLFIGKESIQNRNSVHRCKYYVRRVLDLDKLK